jgi:protein O-mannosyl-transferase
MRVFDNLTQSQFLSKPGFMEVVVCAATALAYIGVLTFGFVYDDNITVVRNTAIRSWQCVPNAFMSPSIDVPFYRPLTVVWFRVNYALFGLNPAWWHLAILACHVLITYLVFVLVHKLVQDRSTAFIAGLLFGLYPLHVENVAWLSAANDLLMSSLLLASLLAFLKYREKGLRRWLVISVGLLALLAKEPSAVLPVLIFAFSLMFKPKAREVRWRACIGRAIQQSAAYWGVLLAYVVVRSLALGSLAPGKMASVSWTTMMLTWPSVLWFDLRHLVLPFGSSEFYALDYVTHPTLRAFVLPLLLLALIAVATAAWVRKLQHPRVASFACLWVLLPLLPTLYLRGLTPSDFVHDRFLYLSSLGLVILVALTIRQLRWSFPGHSRTAIQWAVVVCLTAACVFGITSYQLQWASDILLYQNGLKFVPDSSNLKDNLANAFVSKGQFKPAIHLYLEVLERDPRFWRSNYNLGYCYYKIGEFPQAEVYLNRAIQIDSSDPDEFMYLAAAQMRQGKLVDAAQSRERAIQKGAQSRVPQP